MRDLEEENQALEEAAKCSAQAWAALNAPQVCVRHLLFVLLLIMIAPGFESHQYLAGMWKRRLGYHAGRQEFSRCHTPDESEGMCNTYASASLNKAGHSGSETQRRRHQKSETGVSVAPQKGLLSSKNVLKNYDRCILNQSYPMKYLFYQKNVSSG